MLKTIIPSKDRAPQLDLLLRSIKRFVRNWQDNETIILRRTTTDESNEAYARLEREHPEFQYHDEQAFRPDFQALALSGDAEWLQLVMDDDVYVKPFGLDDPEVLSLRDDPNVAAISLRMAPSMDYCYAENAYTGAPWFRADRCWLWMGLIGDWGYPHSVDASIWRMEDVATIIESGQYTMLHQLEPELRLAMRRPLCRCYAESRVLNVANNSVQDSCPPNRHAGGDANSMTKRYLSGERIELEPLCEQHPKSPHFEYDFTWSNGNGP